MIYTFKRKRIFQACGCLALAALASAFLALGLAAPPDAAPIKWIAIPAAAGMYALLIPVLQETFTPGPILTIGPEGLTYQPFSLQPIAWTDLATVKRIRQRRGDGKPADTKRDVVMFDVRDVAQISLRRGFGGAMMATHRSMLGGIQISAVQASADEIVAAIKTYRPIDIPIVEP